MRANREGRNSNYIQLFDGGTTCNNNIGINGCGEMIVRKLDMSGQTENVNANDRSVLSFFLKHITPSQAGSH